LWGRSGAHLREAPFNCSTLGLAPVLLANVRVDQKSLPGTNTSAYYMGTKKVITLAPDLNFARLGYLLGSFTYYMQ